jgi:PHD-finger
VASQLGGQSLTYIHLLEEIRRSGRATKGQYTKDRDINDEATSKRQGKGKKGRGKAETEPSGDEEDEYIRCVCGHYEPEEESERSMICCDTCSAWQHNDCMGLPDDPSYAPPEYFCEQCKPENHKGLLAGMARGEKPWEEVGKRREAAEAEKLAKKKGPKKGRKSGARASEDVEATPPGKKGVNGQKRKLEEASNGFEPPLVICNNSHAPVSSTH